MQSIPTNSLVFFGVILLVIVAVNPSFSQPIRGASYDRTLQVALEKCAEQDYVNALDYFEMAFEAKKDESLLPDMAELYLQIRDYSSASKTYAKILKKDIAYFDCDQCGYVQTEEPFWLEEAYETK